MKRVRLLNDCAEGEAGKVLTLRDAHAIALVRANKAAYFTDEVLTDTPPRPVEQPSVWRTKPNMEPQADATED